MESPNVHVHHHNRIIFIYLWCVAFDSDINDDAEVEQMTRTEEGGFHRAGIGPSAGVEEFPPLAQTGEARVDDLSLGVYAPSSHALVIKVVLLYICIHAART